MSDNSKPTDTPPKPNRSYSAWFGFARRELTGRGSVRLHIRWGRVMILLLILGAFFWGAKSYALYYFFKNIRDFEAVSFVDMILFPANRSAVRVEQGNYQIEKGKEALDREDYRRAYSLLREGVARSPSNTEGRLLLGQIYAGWRPDLAAEILADGVEYGIGDTDYIRAMVQVMLSQKEDREILALTEELLTREDLESDITQILNVARLQSAMYLGQYDIVREVFETTDLRSSLDGVVLGAQLYLRSGRIDTAIDVLISVIQAQPQADISVVYNQLINAYKELEMYDEAREVALDQVIKHPMKWQPRIALIDILSASERTERRDREIDALLQQHRNDEQAMTILAQLTAGYGNVRSASRLYEIALENGYSLSLFSLALAEAMVYNGEHQRAIDLCNELILEDPGWLVTAESSFNAVRSLAYFSAGDFELGDLYLRDFLESARTNVNQLYQAALKFQEYGFLQQALDSLVEAHERDPDNEIILSSLVDVEMNLGAYFSIDQHLVALFDLRRPDYELLEEIHQRLQSDRFLFTVDRLNLLNQLESILAERDEMDWDIWERVSSAEPSES